MRQITGQESLLERAPVLQNSIRRRNPYVDSLSFLQLVLLRRLRAGERPRDELLTAVLESVNGVVRMQQRRQKRLTQGLLDLKRLYWNMHTFAAGKRKR